MNFTRRNVTIGGMSLLASASMSTLGRAELGDSWASVRDLRTSRSLPAPTSWAIR